MTIYCKDCKWIERRWFFGKFVPEFPKCLNPKVYDQNEDHKYMVTGLPSDPPFASATRISPCGPEAKYFEPYVK